MLVDDMAEQEALVMKLKKESGWGGTVWNTFLISGGDILLGGVLVTYVGFVLWISLYITVLWLN